MSQPRSMPSSVSKRPSSSSRRASSLAPSAASSDSSARSRSRSARATNVDVMTAVVIATKAMPSSITNAPTARPIGCFGVTSP